MKPMLALLLAVLLCGYFGLVPFPCSDVADLAPAQILILSDEDTSFVCTDGNLAARGDTLSQALRRLQLSARGKLLLATVDQVVFVRTPADADLLLQAGIRPATALYLAPALPADADSLAAYLRERKPQTTLGQYAEDADRPIPRLHQGVNGLILEDTP